MLWYEDIYFDVGQEYRVKGDRHAVELMKRGLAHNLRYNEANNAMNFLRDLAETYLWVGELDQGLAMFAGLLRNDPADIWTYNVIAITFDRFGLTEVGAEATRRGLELIEAAGDPEKLRGQLLDALEDMRKSERRGREAGVDPAVLADLRAVLALDFDAGRLLPITELCRELVPDLDRVPVKAPPEMPDLPPPPVLDRGQWFRQAGRKLGRNDPCWCGSGKKYKHCHLKQDRAAKSEAVQVASARVSLYDRLLDFSWDRDGQTEISSAFDLFWDRRLEINRADELNPGQLHLFMEWFLFDFARGEDRKTALQLFMEEKGRSLHPRERELLNGWDRSRMSLYRAAEVSDGVVEVNDLLRGGQASVSTPGQAMPAGAAMLTRLLEEPDAIRLGRGGMQLPAAQVDPLTEHARQRFEIYQEEHYQATWDDFLRHSAYALVHFALDQWLPRTIERPERDDMHATAWEIVRQMQGGIITGTLEQHYARWADTPVPAWRNRTPRQMLRVRDGREQVEAVLDELERVEEAKRVMGQPFYEVDRLRHILGLIEEERPVGGGVLVG